MFKEETPDFAGGFGPCGAKGGFQFFGDICEGSRASNFQAHAATDGNHACIEQAMKVALLEEYGFEGFEDGIRLARLQVLFERGD